MDHETKVFLTNLFESIEKRFDSMEKRFDTLEGWFDAKVDYMDNRFDQIENEMDDLAKDVRENQKQTIVAIEEVEKRLTEEIENGQNVLNNRIFKVEKETYKKPPMS